MSGEKVFLDTNVLVYFYSNTDSNKQRKASSEILTHQCVISTQVLSELSNVSIKKLLLPISQIQRDIQELLNYCTLSIIDADTIIHALTVQSRYGFSYYDSLIIASAIESGCGHLFSEDLSDGQIIDGVTVRNIFADGM
jgi:predicted nucleic acid-binding protein